MPINELYQAAREFLQAEPWTVVGQAGRFAIDGLGEETAYVMVTGGVERSLTLFLDAQAMASYASLVSAETGKADEMELASLHLEQDHLICQFDQPDTAQREELRGAQKAFPGTPLQDVPVCRRFQFARFPRPLDEKEEQLLIVALRAAADLKQIEDPPSHEKGAPVLCAHVDAGQVVSWSSVDIPVKMAVGYPAPKLQDELALRRLSKQKCSGATFSCAVRLLPLPIEGEVPHAPIALVMIDDQQGVIGMPMIEDYEKEAGRFATEFLGYIEEFGRPALIRTTDPRTYCLVGGLARQVGIPVEQGCRIPEVNDVMRSFVNYMKQNELKEIREAEKKKRANANGQGICLLCEHAFTRSSMTRHLKECASKHRAPGETGYFMIRVCDAEDPDFWMYLEVKTDASLKQLDQALRDIWVECCGHLSMFCIGNEEYQSAYAEHGQHNMSAKLDKLLRVGSKFRYEYDFGTPTQLKLQVVDKYDAKNRRKKVEVAARNIMPGYTCVCCGRPAQWVFRPGGEPVAESVYCDECADSMDESMLPLLNSPRTGVCGYGMWLGDDDFEDDDE